MEYSYIFFDVANTLLYKPLLYKAISQSLLQFGISVDKRIIEEKHTLVASILTTPPKTSKNFYDEFNAELLHSFGILPKKELVDTIYNNCKNLPWEPFEDTKALSGIKISKGIISNWDDSLGKKITKFFPGEFTPIVSSSQVGISKPDVEIFFHALSITNLPPKRVIHVGDSLKLDIEPASKIGIRAILIDRHDRYPYFQGEKIASFYALPKLLDKLQHEK